MYAKIENGLAVEYPLYEGQLQDRFPDRTYPDASLDGYQYHYELGLPINEDGKWIETWNKIPYSAEEIQNNLQYISYALRQKRNSILSESDKMVCSDRWQSYSEQQKLEWTDYRQALRDFPDQEGFPLTVEWPLEPSVFSVKIIK